MMLTPSSLIAKRWRRMMLGDSERADTAGPGPATIAHIPTDRTRVLSGRPRPSTSSGAVSRTAARNGKGDYIRARYRSGPDDILARHTEGKQGMSSPCLTPDLSQATSAVAFAMNERASIPKSGNRRMSRIEASGIKKSREALAKDRQGKRVLRFLAQQQQTPSGGEWDLCYLPPRLWFTLLPSLTWSLLLDRLQQCQQRGPAERREESADPRRRGRARRDAEQGSAGSYFARHQVIRARLWMGRLKYSESYD